MDSAEGSRMSKEEIVHSGEDGCGCCRSTGAPCNLVSRVVWCVFLRANNLKGKEVLLETLNHGLSASFSPSGKVL